MDYIGPFQPSEGFMITYILLIIDMFTRWLIAVPCVNADSFTTASVFISEVYCQHGAPRTVPTDQGPHFVSNFLKPLWAGFDIDKRQSTPMHLQSNAMVERAVATVKER
jgi:transposase InsO family protein